MCGLRITESHLRCDAASYGKWCFTFQREMEVTHSFMVSGSTYRVIQQLIPNPRLRVRTRPKPSDFLGRKNPQHAFLRRGVKPSVPCRRFTARKRSLNATWKPGISGNIHRPFLAHIVPPLATRISGETTSGESWNI
jgi:hypothetical protein